MTKSKTKDPTQNITPSLILHYLAVCLIAFWMLFGAYGHFFHPEFFYKLVPDFLPKWEVVILTGIPELLIGLGVLFPRTRPVAGLGFTLLCLAFLPLHLWDLVREDPAITPQSAAIFRVFLQFFLMWVGWKVWTRWRPQISKA